MEFSKHEGESENEVEEVGGHQSIALRQDLNYPFPVHHLEPMQDHQLDIPTACRTHRYPGAQPWQSTLH